MSGKIFINYRREDSSAWAGRLSDHLSAHFPQSQIFMDVDMDLGINFVEEIEKNVESCDVLIAVIGKRWLISTDEKRRRRIGNPDDFVRLEIATALKRNIRVVPVLVDGASMPSSGQLPENLKPLALRHALNVSHERFRADAERSIGGVGRALESARVDQQRKREEQERLAAEQRECEEKGRLEHVPQSQPPAPATLFIATAQSKADELPAEIPKVVHPLPPKPAEPELVKPTSPASSLPLLRDKRKLLWAGIITLFVICLAVVGAIYLGRQYLPAEWLAEAQRNVDTHDYAKAQPLLQKAADAGNTAAMYNLAELYISAEELGKGREWFQKAADAGNAAAMYKLGWLYENAWGVAQDLAKARDWYQKAADAGNAAAMYNLGWLYENGKGGARDQGKARDWYQKAADAGNTDAKQALERWPRK
jgi:TPR repeat protein